MSQGALRKYGVQTTIDFELYEVDGVDLRVDWVPAQVDCEIMKDGGASTLCDNTATDEGSTYSIVLTATEMQFARGVLKMVDAATKVFLDKVVIIETYGNASAQHAFDLDTAVQTVDLAADAIKAVSYDETTAFPLVLADTGSDKIARTGADSDTLETLSGQIDSIGTGSTGGTHVEATFDNTTRDTIDNAGADLKGGGLVGIPVTGHSFVAGREITIAGSVAYNGAHAIVSQTTNEVVITHSQDAEAFGGSETIVSSIKGEIFVGTITSGTFADTAARQGTLHSMDDDGDVIKIVYGFNIGGSRQATLVSLFANVDGNTDQMIVKVYNFVTSAFEAKRTLSGSGGTSFIELDPALVSRNTGTGVEIGDVFIFLDTVTTTPSSLDVDECLLTAVGTNVLIGYPNGFEIAAAGTSGTEFGVNGTAGNPCPFADAVTMNAANPLNQFNIHNGETVELNDDSTNLTLKGEAWTLLLNSQVIAGAHFEGPHVTGTGTSAGAEAHFVMAKMGTCTIPQSFLHNCGIGDAGGTLTAGSAGEFIFEDCYSMAPGSAVPVFTFTGLGSATGVNNRGWKGGATWNVDSDITISHCTLVAGGTTFNTSGADIEVRGPMRSLTVAFSAGGTTPTVQFIGITGPIVLSGTSAAGTTVNLYGISASLADSSSNTTVTDETVSFTDVDAILTDTTEIGTAGAGLTNINLPNQTMDIVGSITGNLSGSVGSVTGAVGSVAGNVDGLVTGTVAGKTPAEAGDAMNLAADAIKAVSYDETTAFPVKSDDSAATQIARVGADGDTLETLSDQIDGTATAANVATALTDINLDHLMKTAVVNNADMTAEVTDGTVLSNMMSKASDTSTYVVADDSLEANRDHIGDGTNLTEAGGDGDHLTAINLPNQTMDITGSLSGSVGSVAGNVDGLVTGTVAGKTPSEAGDAMTLTAAATSAQLVDDVLDEVVEGTVTLRQALRLALSVLTGKSSGGGTATLIFRDIGDTKDRISCTVDANGNRTAVGTRDGS